MGGINGGQLYQQKQGELYFDCFETASNFQAEANKQGASVEIEDL